MWCQIGWLEAMFVNCVFHRTQGSNANKMWWVLERPFTGSSPLLPENSYWVHYCGAEKEIQVLSCLPEMPGKGKCKSHRTRSRSIPYRCTFWSMCLYSEYTSCDNVWDTRTCIFNYFLKCCFSPIGQKVWLYGTVAIRTVWQLLFVTTVLGCDNCVW